MGKKKGDTKQIKNLEKKLKALKKIIKKQDGKIGKLQSKLKPKKTKKNE
jgi:hypothetical protein